MAAETYAELAASCLRREVGVVEVGDNTGPRIKVYQAADGLRMSPDTGYPYCAAGVDWAFEEVGRPLVELQESASVGLLLSAATKHKWNVPRNEARFGDCVCFYWGTQDDWPDHIGFVLERIAPNGFLTVEANTTPDGGGREGVWTKRRGIERMTFFRVPGVPPERKIQVAPDAFERWAAWYLKKPKRPPRIAKYEAEHKAWLAARPEDAPRKIDDKWWMRLVEGIKP